MSQQPKQHLNTQTLLNGMIFLLLIIIALLAGYYFLTKNSQQTTSHLTSRSTFENFIPSAQETFDFNTLDGKTIHINADTNQFNIEGFENKLVFLKIFGWDCKYCQKEIPELVKLKRDLNNEFEIIAIEAKQFSKEESLNFVKKLGINYPIIAGGDYFNFFAYLKTHYAWSDIIPLTIVIGKQGKVLAFEVGSKSYSLSELMKASLLKDNQ